MLPKAVTEYLEANREGHLKKLLELLAIPSIANRDDGQCSRAAEWLAGYLRGLGSQARVCPA